MDAVANEFYLSLKKLNVCKKRIKRTRAPENPGPTCEKIHPRRTRPGGSHSQLLPFFASKLR